MKEVKTNNLFKYHQINDHLFKLLESNSFWLSKLSELDDPFDCKIVFSMEFSIRMGLEKNSIIFNDLQNENFFSMGLNEDEFYNGLILPSSKSDKLRTEWQQDYLDSSGFRICCFSEKRDIDPMWQYYAAKYTGVCLEFNFLNDLNHKIKKVEYSEKLPEVNSAETIGKRLLQKKSTWSYQKEWRIIEMNQENICFSKSALKSIYFGKNVDKVKQEDIITKMKSYGYDSVKFFSSKIIPLSSEISFSEIVLL